MKVNVEKKPKSTVLISIEVSVEQVKQTYETLLTDVVKEAELPGFRKGHAPKEKVLEKTDVSKLYGEVVNKLLQTYYPQALKEHRLSPISNPKVEIKQFDLEKDFIFDATVAVRPEIKVSEFENDLKSAFKVKREKLSQINAEKLKAGEKIDTDHAHLIPNEIIDVILKKTEVEIAELVIDEEVDRMMARLVDQAQSIGLSLEAYLKAQQKTADDLRKDYSTLAEKNLKAEFMLSYLVLQEKVQVTDTEIEDTIRASGEENVTERMQNSMEKWYIKSVLEKNKLLAKLAEEAEKEEK